jgi:hypothetical protein
MVLFADSVSANAGEIFHDISRDLVIHARVLAPAYTHDRSAPTFAILASTPFTSSLADQRHPP